MSNCMKSQAQSSATPSLGTARTYTSLLKKFKFSTLYTKINFILSVYSRTSQTLFGKFVKSREPTGIKQQCPLHGRFLIPHRLDLITPGLGKQADATLRVEMRLNRVIRRRLMR